MRTPNHTPGPWRIVDSIDQSKVTIVGSDFPAMGFVADVNLCRNNTHQQVDGRANAALIAAAPAMYEACKAARGNMTGTIGSPSMGRCLKLLREAINQAEGNVRKEAKS